jgi:hypothetical protein
MELSTDQIRALENGEAVPVIIERSRCVILRTDIYERLQVLLDNKLPRSKLRGIKRKKHCLGAKQASGNRTLQGIEDTYPLIDETFREGWEAPGMADYDRYDALQQQCRFNPPCQEHP